jgi:NADPH2:quinone reductase
MELSMARVIRVHEPGGVESLRLDDVDVPAPAAGAVRVRQRAVGVNYIDVYHRSGLYPAGPAPSGVGVEASGVVDAVGEGVTGVKKGDRVGYATAGPGAYAELRNVPASALIPLPIAIDFKTAASVLLKGMTAEYLVRRVVAIDRDHTVLWHAAAGATGSIAIQWLRSLGATVIGTVGSEEKVAIARANGCAHVILYREEDVAARTRELTGGRGVDVVYDGVGQSTFEASLSSLRPRGTLVSFGNASGPPPKLDVLELMRRGSLWLTRPSLFDYVREREELLASAAAVFEAVTRGSIRPQIGLRLPLDQAADAHRALESRSTTGATVLIP